MRKTFDEVEFHDWKEVVSVNVGDRFTPHTAVIEKSPVYKVAYVLMTQTMDVFGLETPFWGIDTEEVACFCGTMRDANKIMCSISRSAIIPLFLACPLHQYSPST